MAGWVKYIGFFMTVVLSQPVLHADEQMIDVEALHAARPAKNISAYNLFADNQSQKPNNGLLPYDLIVPLFTDYALKYRFVHVPEGSSANYNDSEAFDFPLGSILVKTFAYPADFRKPDKNIRLIETRLLIKEARGWQAWAYIWNDDMTDAKLKVAGARMPVSYIDKLGLSVTVNYAVPNRNQCKGCHTKDREFTPLGPKARNINRDYNYKFGAANQLEHWSVIGYLSGAPKSSQAPKVPRVDDVKVPIAQRARAYLDINCAHCHRAAGPASTSGLFLTFSEKNPVNWGYMRRPVAAGRGSGGLEFDVVPGKPDRSILIYRMASTDPGVMMPELGRNQVHVEGLALIRAWILSLD